MNWRINLTNYEVRECIKEENYEWLYEFDQLHRAVRDDENEEYKDYVEGTIDFPPTYKFDANSN